MASLHELHRAVFPTARTVGDAALGAEPGDREVRWVRVITDRTPGVETLDDGDLVILSPDLGNLGPGLAPEVARDLATAGIPAAIVLEGRGASGRATAEAIGQATHAAGVPTLLL